MRRTPIIVLGLLALAAAVWLGLRVGDSRPVVTRKPTGTENEASRTAATMVAAPEPTTDPAGPADASVATKAARPNPEAAPVLTGPEVIEQWLSSSTDVPEIVRTLLAGFPKLDPQDQLLAAGKVAALADDLHYEGVKRLLVDEKTSADAKEFLYRDAFNRGAEVKLPTMFAVMTTPGHPQAKEAHEALVNHLGADYGANQGQWLASIQANLRERAAIGK